MLPDFLEEMRRHAAKAAESVASREFHLRQAERYAVLSMAESLRELAGKVSR